MKNAVIVSACRTAIGKFQGQFRDVSARDLAVTAGKEAIRRAGIDIKTIEEIVMGECYPHMQGSLPARQVSMRIGLDESSNAVTVNQNCASGMRALEIACSNIQLGKTEIGLVIGTENMTQAPFMLTKARMGYRMGSIPTGGTAELIDSLIHDALYDELVPGHMGVTADNVAKLCGITRQACDELAVRSHQRACAAIDAGKILLVDYHRLIIYDKLLPAGRLREPLNGKDRADIVIVTKCPKDLKPMEFRVVTKAMHLYPYQRLYFTTLEYAELQSLFQTSTANIPTLDSLHDTHVMLLTGIASPEQLEHDLAPFSPHLTPLTFADHYQFKAKDIELINNTFATMQSPKIIITTEKDATRLNTVGGLSDEVKKNMYVLPVRISFMQDQDNMFNQQITDYVRKNSRNSILAKGKDDHKSNNSHHSGNRPRTISFRDNR